MRVNVYSEEYLGNCDVVVKEAEGKRFYGIRILLKSSPDLHYHERDDDRSAVTFWCQSDGQPWDRTAVARMLSMAAETLRKT